MWTKNFQIHNLGLEKAEEQEIKLLTFVGSQRQQGSSRKLSTSVSLTTRKTLVNHNNCGKFLKRWEYQTTSPASCETCMQVKKQQLEPGMEQ